MDVLVQSLTLPLGIFLLDTEQLKDKLAMKQATNISELTKISELPDFIPYKIKLLPTAVDPGSESLILSWDDGSQSEYHYLWLRDNCACSQCVTPLTREQVFEICDVPLDIRPSQVTISDDGRLLVTWDNDQHQSRFHPGWLKAHCYSKQARAERYRTPEIWDKVRISEQLPQHQFKQVMQDDQALLGWLRDQRDYGIALIKGVETTPGTVAKVANRISFIRETNFGVLFDVKAKPNANSAAYTTLRLPLHTDLPTRELQPGLQFLHCLINDAGGGESILVDGFKIADHMRHHFPDEFEALSTVAMEFRNTDKDSDYRFCGPALVLDTTGEVVEIRLGNFLRGPLDVPSDQVTNFYRGYRCFMTLTRQASFQFYYRLGPGDLIVFDNRRVLHARNAFDLQQGERHLQGCYVDRDELLSRIRVLERAI